jgi:hypothetical protein
LTPTTDAFGSGAHCRVFCLMAAPWDPSPTPLRPKHAWRVRKADSCAPAAYRMQGSSRSARHRFRSSVHDRRSSVGSALRSTRTLPTGRVLARTDNRTLEARGILGESIRVSSENGRAVCDPELAQSCIAGWRMQRNLLDYKPPSPWESPP